jgi:hypothetical protein
MRRPNKAKGWTRTEGGPNPLGAMWGAIVSFLEVELMGNAELGSKLKPSRRKR